MERLPSRPWRRRRQAAQNVGCPARVHVKGSKFWRGRARMGTRRGRIRKKPAGKSWYDDDSYRTVGGLARIIIKEEVRDGGFL